MSNNIRTMTKQDIKDVLSLNYDPSWKQQDFEIMLNNPSYTALVYEFEGKIIAYLTLLHTGESSDILQIVVSKHHRKKGIASQLFKTMLKRNKGKSIFLEVNEFNCDALFLYRKYGFHEISRRERYYDKKDAALIMRKEVVM